MPIEITFEEKYPESRSLSFTETAVDQTIVGHISGNFFEEATSNAANLYDDDIVMLGYLYPRLPLFISLPLYNGLIAILTIKDLQVSQINETTWKFTLKYGVPNNGGKSGGGMGTNNIGEVGPDPTREYSNNFTQVSFNVSAEQRTRNMSMSLLAGQKNVAVGGLIPYEIGKAAPIGQTQDGIEGTSVYERQFSFQVTAYFEPTRLTYAYVQLLHYMATTVNLQPFFGFASTSCTMDAIANFSPSSLLG